MFHPVQFANISPGLNGFFRARLESEAPETPNPEGVDSAGAVPLDRVRELNGKFDRMIAAIENLTAAIVGADVD